jgi:hypothetical protein
MKTRYLILPIITPRKIIQLTKYYGFSREKGLFYECKAFSTCIVSDRVNFHFFVRVLYNFLLPNHACSFSCISMEHSLRHHQLAALELFLYLPLF